MRWPERSCTVRALLFEMDNKRYTAHFAQYVAERAEDEVVVYILTRKKMTLNRMAVFFWDTILKFQRNGQVLTEQAFVQAVNRQYPDRGAKKIMHDMRNFFRTLSDAGMFAILQIEEMT